MLLRSTAPRSASFLLLCFVAMALLLLAPNASHATTNPAFVDKVFQDLLLRPASPSDISFWTPQLDSAILTRQQFALDLLNSQEYSHVRAIEFYNDYLSRSPSPTEASSLTNIIQNSTLPTGRTVLLGGGEYFSTQAGSTNPGFLNALFLD